MNIIISILCASLSVAANLPHATKCVVTGPSQAKASIIPVAQSDDGVILCLTETFVNPMGAHAMMDTQFGYLVVDKNGLWEEKVITVFESTDNYDSLDLFRKKFYSEIDFENVREDLKEVIKLHRIDRLVYETGKNQYFWTKNGIYDGNDILLTSKNEQKSIAGYTNVKGKGTRTGTSFALHGVLFFDNRSTFDENGDNLLLVGAAFLEKEFDYPIDLYTVTGICLLP